jgi:ArsR family transcriptional regulator, virulence genes transcriptional regulator
MIDTNDEIWSLHAQYCSCFSSEKRLQILYLLKEHERSVGEIAELIKLTPQNVSQHLRIMKDRGVVAYRKEGQTVYYHLTNDKFSKACELFREALNEQLLSQGRLAH